MRVAVIGAGAIGSTVAACLTRAGVPCVLVGRQEHIQILLAKGLTIRFPDREETITLEVYPRLPRRFDLVIFAVKTQDLEEAYQENQLYLDQGLVLTSQGGVQADTLLGFHFEQDQMISGIVTFVAACMVPGEVVVHFPGEWVIGRPYGPNDLALERTAEVLRMAFPVLLSRDIMGMKWLKLFAHFNNCIPALVGLSIQETFADLDLCRLSVRLLKEGVDIVRRADIPLVSLPQFPVEQVLGLAAMPEDQAAGILQKTLTAKSRDPLHGPVLQSILRGRPSEIDFINGEVVEVANSRLWKAPLNRLVVDLVHQVERKGRFFAPDEIKTIFALKGVSN